MKTIEKTSKKVVIEITDSELREKCFDAVWDSIREIYPQTTYIVDSSDIFNEGKIILVTLLRDRTIG